MAPSHGNLNAELRALITASRHRLAGAVNAELTRLSEHGAFLDELLDKASSSLTAR